jgi:hypothetical protein
MADAESKVEFQLPGEPLTIGQPEPRFPVSHRDWQRLRGRVAALTDPVPHLTEIGWVFVGISFTTFLSFIAWVPAYSQLPSPAQGRFSWIGPIMLVSMIAAAIIAVFSFRVNRLVEGTLRRDAQHVVEDMDHIYAPHRQPVARVEIPADTS